MHTVSENQCGKYALLLQQARTEAQADASCSVRSRKNFTISDCLAGRCFDVLFSFSCITE